MRRGTLEQRVSNLARHVAAPVEVSQVVEGEVKVGGHEHRPQEELEIPGSCKVSGGSSGVRCD